MIFRIGYVNGPETIPFCYTHTLTYTNYQKLGKQKGKQKLYKIIDTNLDNLYKLLNFNIENEINFYRLGHNLIPLATIKDIKINYNNFKEKFSKIGNFIKENNIRIDTHPSEYLVLNSINENVVKNSIDILNYNYKLFTLFNIEGLIIIHIGSSALGKEESIKRFKENYKKLDNKIKKLIILENDDKVFNTLDVLNICEELNIPMVLDYHHYLCNNNNEKLKDLFPRIMKTWENSKYKPKLHFSSPKEKKNFRSHSYFIDYKGFIKFINIIKIFNYDIDIMLECKGKEDALLRLSRQLKYTENIKTINNTTFSIE